MEQPSKYKRIQPYINNLLKSSIDIDRPEYKNLTHLKTYTIDDIDTVEVDDALSIEYLDNSTRVWVHITSPAEYIKFDDPIDLQASRRAATCYLPRGPIYMLPKNLITELLSLKQGRINLALSIAAEISPKGDII